MRSELKYEAPEGFITLIREGMEKREISLNQLAERAGVSPAFLSRILNRQRGLPSDKTIMLLAEVLEIEPVELLLIEAGRVPEAFKTTLSRPQIPALLRVTGKLSETDMQRLINTAQALALRQHAKGKRK